MIDVAPLERPEWADADTQLPALRRHLGVEHDAHDEQIKALFRAAIDELDGPKGWLGRTLVPAVVRSPLHLGRTGGFLPLPPVIEVIGFETADAAGEWTQTDRVTGAVDQRGYMTLRGVGGSFGLRAVYHAGYLDEGHQLATPDTTVPANLPIALLMIVQSLYERPDPAKDPYRRCADALLGGLRIYG